MCIAWNLFFPLFLLKEHFQRRVGNWKEKTILYILFTQLPLNVQRKILLTKSPLWGHTWIIDDHSPPCEIGTKKKTHQVWFPERTCRGSFPTPAQKEGYKSGERTVCRVHYDTHESLNTYYPKTEYIKIRIKCVYSFGACSKLFDAGERWR